MSFRKMTIAILITATLGLIAWDIIAYINEENSTFSVVITDIYYAYPAFGYVVTFVFGLGTGHWFFPAKGSKD